jgi:hypothetical protein
MSTSENFMKKKLDISNKNIAELLAGFHWANINL